MDYIFKALADPTRRELLDRLREKSGQTLGDLCKGLNISRQSVTKHLNILEEVNLVSVVWQGREKRHYLNPIPIRDISRRWVSKFSRNRADALLDLKHTLEENMTNKLEFNYVSYIAAPREKVWQALTDPAFTRRYWFESVVECDWKEGSTYRFWMDDENGGRREGLRGEVLKVNKPKELVYTFTFPTNEDVKDETSKVQFLLEEEEGLTKLTVRHYGFQDDSKMFEIVNSGWPVLLSGLKTLLESGRELKKTA